MGQVLHGFATTTEAVRRAIQNSQESLRALAKRYGSIRRPSQSGRSAALSPICRPAQKSRSQHRFPLKTMRSSSLSASIRCCRSMIASMPCKPRSRISRDHPCIAACSATASAGLPDVEWTKPAKKEVQDLSDRLLPYRYRRGPDRRGQALSLSRHQPNQQIRLRPTGQKDRKNLGLHLLGVLNRRCPLQDPRRPHRQLRPVHFPAALRRWTDGQIHNPHV